MRLSDVGYKEIKKLVTLLFPGLSSLIFLASYIWTLSSAKFVIGLCAVCSLFCGFIMHISTKRYLDSEEFYDGRLVVSILKEGNKKYLLELAGDPEDLEQKKAIMFKVVSSNPEVESL